MATLPIHLLAGAGAGVGAGLRLTKIPIHMLDLQFTKKDISNEVINLVLSPDIFAAVICQKVWTVLQ
jgi:hypothetical protein